MRQYRIRDEPDREYRYVPQYSDDGAYWRNFVSMCSLRFRIMQDAVETIEKDIEEKRKEKDFEDRVIYYTYPLK